MGAAHPRGGDAPPTLTTWPRASDLVQGGPGQLTIGTQLDSARAEVGLPNWGPIVLMSGQLATHISQPGVFPGANIGNTAPQLATHGACTEIQTQIPQSVHLDPYHPCKRSEPLPNEPSCLQGMGRARQGRLEVLCFVKNLAIVSPGHVFLVLTHTLPPPVPSLPLLPAGQAGPNTANPVLAGLGIYFARETFPWQKCSCAK